MNPFINPNKRDVTLPAGCKDLIDVLGKPEPKPEPETASRINAALRFAMQIPRVVRSMFFEAQRLGATKIVIGRDITTPIRCRVQDKWQDMGPFSYCPRFGLIRKLAEMAKFPAGQIVGSGLLQVQFVSPDLSWILTITSAKGDCMLVRAE